VIRTFRYPLEPNRRQAAILSRWLELCRILYNVALEQRRDGWRRAAPKSVSYMDQTRELTELRDTDSRYSEMPAVVCRSPLRTLQRAFDGFFRRLKRGQTPAYPRFQGLGRFDSFAIGRVSAEGKKVRIPKLGLLKFRKYRELGGVILEARVGLRAGRWWIAFSCDVGEAPAKKAPKNPVGIDLGLDSFLVLSDGRKVQNPRFFRRAGDQLAARQRVLSRKKPGSGGRARARLLVQKAHDHVRNQRLDFARKIAAELYRSYDIYEELAIRGWSEGGSPAPSRMPPGGCFWERLPARQNGPACGQSQ
jgi:putative transposase